jgi:hypothetical protein
LCDPETGWCATPEVWEELNPRATAILGLDGSSHFPPKTFQLPRSWEDGKRKGYSEVDLQELVDLGLIQPPNPWLMDISRRSISAKFMGALPITEVYLPEPLEWLTTDEQLANRSHTQIS